MGTIIGKFNRVLKSKQRQMLQSFQSGKVRQCELYIRWQNLRVRNRYKIVCSFSNFHPKVLYPLLKPFWSKFFIVLFFRLPVTIMSQILKQLLYTHIIISTCRQNCLTYIYISFKPTAMLQSQRDFALDHNLDCFYLEYFCFK